MSLDFFVFSCFRYPRYQRIIGHMPNVLNFFLQLRLYGPVKNKCAITYIILDILYVVHIPYYVTHIAYQKIYSHSDVIKCTTKSTRKQKIIRLYSICFISNLYAMVLETTYLVSNDYPKLFEHFHFL